MSLLFAVFVCIVVYLYEYDHDDKHADALSTHVCLIYMKNIHRPASSACTGHFHVSARDLIPADTFCVTFCDVDGVGGDAAGAVESDDEGTCCVAGGGVLVSVDGSEAAALTFIGTMFAGGGALTSKGLRKGDQSRYDAMQESARLTHGQNVNV